ncbi:hypothetical protein FSP39_022915 [Pinctada imbricata]|uniref:MADF domain-containing protein n=1 Tax=Pinctada imbricata TaxID=66713 RepID=A0AA89BXX7_PINIB|nr:hypothetical protein FSP39_022915 [Pinctada imbricata]
MASNKKKGDELKLNGDQMEKLIELYQSESDLWNISAPTYSKKECRQKALNNIKERMMEQFEGLVCTGTYENILFEFHY